MMMTCDTDLNCNQPAYQTWLIFNHSFYVDPNSGYGDKTEFYQAQRFFSYSLIAVFLTFYDI